MEIHIGDRVADVTLVSKEGNKVQFMIDGKPYDVDIVMAENGSCSILHDGNSFNAELIRGEGGKSYDVNMFYRSYHVDIVDTQTKYLRMKKGGEERQDDKIVAPMPGKVIKIPVRKGDRLSSGDIVVVLEGRHSKRITRSNLTYQQIHGAVFAKKRKNPLQGNEVVSKPNTDVIATGEEFHKQMGSIIDGKHSGITQKLFFPNFWKEQSK